MALTPLEIMATIIIALAVIKIIVLLINPKSWFNFAKTVHSNPTVTSIAGLILAGVTLYYLLQEGVTIVHILAMMLFFMFLFMIGIAPYSKKLINWAAKKDMKVMFREMWLYTLIWIVLLVWGIKEIFF